MEEERSVQTMSPEIVEIEEGSVTSERDRERGGVKDVYIAVGKDDLEVVKWALDHVVSPGATVFLVHVYPPIGYIPTPVGKLSRSQLSQEQARFYINEENNRRRNLLQKYISLCTDAKVDVDTMLIESSATTKSILDLIPILNITLLVMGKKWPHSSRRPMKGLGKAEFVQKNAPKCCEVIMIYNSKKVMNCQKMTEPSVTSILSSRHRRSEVTQQSERTFFGCMCFSAGKSS